MTATMTMAVTMTMTMAVLYKQDGRIDEDGEDNRDVMHS
jgi:hypothetical protein